MQAELTLQFRFALLTGVFVLVILLVIVFESTASITSPSTISLSTRTTEPTHRRISGSSILRSRDHKLAFAPEDLGRFVQDRSKLREDRAVANATTFVMLDFRLGDTHPIHLPIDVRSIR